MKPASMSWWKDVCDSLNYVNTRDSLKPPPCVVHRWAGGSLIWRPKVPLLSPGQGNLVNKNVIAITRWPKQLNFAETLVSSILVVLLFLRNANHLRNAAKDKDDDRDNLVVHGALEYKTQQGSYKLSFIPGSFDIFYRPKCFSSARKVKHYECCNIQYWEQCT